MEMLKKYAAQRWGILVMLLGWLAMFAAVFTLYALPLEAVLYAGLLGGTVTAAAAVLDFGWWCRKQKTLENLLGHVALGLEGLPEPWGPTEKTYQQLLKTLYRELQALETAADKRQRDMIDYYTLWAHQIKTPIAAMNLLLQKDESEPGRELAAELFKVEQYVEMVLQYLRLGSDSTDYVIRRVPLESVVRQAVRKYAPLFIRSKVALDLKPLDLQVLTDEKWLGFVVEQVLSNAVKYARGGLVTVETEGEDLVIRDNGIGIAPEDLPRVFDNGYTGCNGRTDQKSTGIGLYLCRQVCRRLGHELSITSQVGRGTEVRIDLSRPLLEVE